MQGINFIAIDFETATGKRASICEAGICVVRDGKIVETRSWLVRPQGNSYSYWNMQIHGIRPNDTADSPEFPEVWTEISKYLKDIPVLVAHNAAFDIGCIRHSLELYGMEKLEITYYCSLRAARKLYSFGCNSLDYLCDHAIPIFPSLNVLLFIGEASTSCNNSKACFSAKASLK